MNISNLTPTKNTTPFKIEKKQIPQETNLSAQYTDYNPIHTRNRNQYIRQCRYLVGSSQDLQHAIKCIQANSVRTGVKPNFVMYKRLNNIDPKIMNTIIKKWEIDIRSMVVGTCPHLYDYQKVIIQELAITGEMYSCFTLSAKAFKEGKEKLLITPVYSEEVDPTIDGITYGNKLDKIYIACGLEFDIDNTVQAFWLRDKEDPMDINKAIRIPIKSMYRNSFQDSCHLRGLPILMNVEYLKNIWKGVFNLPIKMKTSLGITGYINTYRADQLQNTPTGAKKGINAYKNPNTGDTPEEKAHIEMIQVQSNATFLFADTYNFAVLKPGEEINTDTGTAVSKDTLGALQHIDSKQAAGLGITAAQFSGDLSKVNFAAGKMGNAYALIWTETHIHPQIINFMTEVFEKWVRVNAISNPIFKNLIVDDEVLIPSWITPESVVIDENKHAKFIETSFIMGTDSVSDYVARKGIDPESHAKGWIADNKTYNYHQIDSEQDPEDDDKDEDEDLLEEEDQDEES